MLGFYFIRQCGIASVESNAILNIRLGNTCFGFGTKKQMIVRNRRSKFNPLPLRIEFNREPLQCDMRVLFHIGCEFFSIEYKTKGETKPGDFWYDTTGLQLEIFGKTLKWQ